MALFGWFSLAVLFAAFIFQVASYKSYKSYKIYKLTFWLSVSAVFLFYLYLVYSRYLGWSTGGGVSKFLVPPYNGISYVFGYELFRFLMYYLVALVAALAFLVSARRLNRRFKEKFFENQEPYLGALSIFLLGYPGWGYAWIYYVVAVLALAVLGSLVVSHLLKKNERFSLYWLWLPVAILVILIKEFLVVSS